MFCHSSFLLSCRLDPINGFCPSSSSHSNILPHPAHWRRFILRRATSGLPQRGHGLPRGSSMALLDHHVDCLAQLGPVTVVNPQIATAGLGIHSADNDKLASAFIIDPDRVGSLIEKRLPFRNYVYSCCSDLHLPSLRIRASIRAFCRSSRFMANDCRISLAVGGMVALARVLACSTVSRLRFMVCSSAC